MRCSASVFPYSDDRSNPDGPAIGSVVESDGNAEDEDCGGGGGPPLLVWGDGSEEGGGDLLSYSLGVCAVRSSLVGRWRSVNGVTSSAGGANLIDFIGSGS